jgi:hypothetical protein
VGLERDIWDDWLAALRSGDYPQTAKRMRWGNHFCALGVLCDIHPDLQWASNRVHGSRTLYNAYDKVADDGDGSWVSTLPRTFKERLNLTNNDMNVVIELNDRGAAFPRIADIVEEQGLLL